MIDCSGAVVGRLCANTGRGLQMEVAHRRDGTRGATDGLAAGEPDRTD
jgi:hypothetical protein